MDDVFGKRAAVQRCQEHKIRNVTSHLPKNIQVNMRRSMQEAYRCRKPARAKKLLGNLQRTLQADHPGAAASLAEGLDETLTVLHFGLSSMLERTLGTTNMIENVNGTIREVTRNVKRWKNGDMVLRWVAAALRHRDEEFDDAVGQAAVVA